MFVLELYVDNKEKRYHTFCISKDTVLKEGLREAVAEYIIKYFDGYFFQQNNRKSSVTIRLFSVQLTPYNDGVSMKSGGGWYGAVKSLWNSMKKWFKGLFIIK